MAGYHDRLGWRLAGGRPPLLCSLGLCQLPGCQASELVTVAIAAKVDIAAKVERTKAA